jgi:hypothetical protein
VPTALFLAVYLGCMAAAARVLRGPAGRAALPAAVAVLVMLCYCGWALAVPAAVAAAVFRRRPDSPGLTGPRQTDLSVANSPATLRAAARLRPSHNDAMLICLRRETARARHR